MYLAFGIGENVVGIVENGKITSTVDADASIGEVVSGTAKEVQSDRMGTRAKSTELVQAVGRHGEYKVSRQVESLTVCVSEGKPISEIPFEISGV